MQISLTANEKLGFELCTRILFCGSWCGGGGLNFLSFLFHGSEKKTIGFRIIENEAPYIGCLNSNHSGC